MATSIRLSPEVEKRLDVLAKTTGRTKAFYLRKIIEEGLPKMEEYYLSEQILQRVRNGEEKVFSSSTIRKDLK